MECVYLYVARFHNGNLLEKNTDSTLVLRELSLDQAGQYYCRASGPAGAIKSKAATLTILGLYKSTQNVPE